MKNHLRPNDPPDRVPRQCPGRQLPDPGEWTALATAVEIVKRARSAAIATDADNRIVTCNRKASELLRCDPRLCPEGATLYSRLEARDAFGNRLFDRHLTFIDALLRGEGVRRFEIQVKKPSGEPGRVAVSVVIVVGEEGQGEGYVYFLEPVAARRSENGGGVEAAPSGPGEAGSVPGDGSLTPRAKESPLTPRQGKILGLLAEGLSDGEIASALHISIHTVRNHLRAILAALEVRNRPQAVARAYREHLI